ncbi:hypothetical protein HZU38_05240 [Mycolicibacterium vanbaalenii]|uniref:hypothetical protein n=1 Tax=Mycolicibacterium vanbaalenii TaxID=110539 RepID=UPI001F405B5E|nr:hypothetical protein [Mycolicibacterium vanbaalenii]UJL29908.1 hypothetical protein HZU38_05240 [Mycolicibacterium vanbaalenii]WND57032.1 hypothetical protein QQA43_01030 [Mycolicibacterium vanbaalenii]
MNALLNSEFWSGLSGPAVAIIVAAALVWLLITGRLVIGKQYDTVVERAEREAETSRKLTEALIEKNAGEEAATNILSAIRQEIAALAKGQG